MKIKDKQTNISKQLGTETDKLKKEKTQTYKLKGKEPNREKTDRKVKKRRPGK